MDIAFVVCGLVVGALIGFTGIGGGSVMTPMLILLFGVHPLAAVGTDLLYAAVTKATGTSIHARRNNVAWRVVGYLAAGSVPGALGSILVLSRFPVRSPELTHVITVAIGGSLLLAAAGLLSDWRSDDLADRREKDGRALRPPGRPLLTMLLGLVLGILVSLTSVGAGAIGIAFLRLLHPQLSSVRLVGTDIAHAVPLTLLAGSGHWLIGDVNWILLVSLLTGSIPGIILASYYADRVPEALLRRGLAVILLTVAVPIITS